ncbi:hypothetical protein GGR54DRAFT_604887 [Hypoxylon sp. NC1633]|nr:hypothetical protein GGR54DRAFT_604887 [Hypoxylon sp. NC1633]
MPPPLPAPSKAAIHALRGIAFGTSCAIGVIVEDRRRRISTLRTAVSNKEKLRSSKRYHGIAGSAALQLDEATFLESEKYWGQLDAEIKRRGDDHMIEAPPRPSSAIRSSSNPAPARPSKLEDVSKPSSSLTTTEAQVSLPPPPRLDSSSHLEHKLKEVVMAVTSILGSNDEERLDRALKKFLDASRSLYAFKQFHDEWIVVSAQICKECQAKGRWEEASKVLTITVNAGPLNESLYYAHNPIPIMDYHLRQINEDGRCLPEAVAAASCLFLAQFMQKPQTHAAKIQGLGRQLLTQNLMLNRANVAHTIYWRVMALLDDPMAFTGWAIQELYQHHDYKSVVKYFLLNFSKMAPDLDHYTKTIDCVVYAVEGLCGWKVSEVLRACERMYRPGNGFLRTRWLMRLLQAHWRRSQDFPATQDFFKEILSMQLLDKVNHPEGVYRTMFEISVQAGENDVARSYHKTAIQKYPHMATDVALRGFIALAIAKSGDWDAVFEVFTEMQALKQGQEKQYDDAFVMVLKIFADSHPAAEIRDFVLRYKHILGVRMHSYIVTMVANKYGECHDMLGFMSWLEYCSKAGFALSSSLLNSVLHNCRTKWGLSYPELRQLYSRIRQLGPGLIDDVTRRIMSQAALTGKTNQGPKVKHGAGSRIVAVNRLAYSGRTTSRRDVYEAMNQQLNGGKLASAITIYNRAVGHGMPPCRHCLRLAVLAALRARRDGFASAMRFIHMAHQQGDDFQLDHIRAEAGEFLVHMQNLISRFESMSIVISPGVMTHMALICVHLGHHERAVALCHLAMERSGSQNLCFSRRSTRVLLMVYSQKLNLEGMKKLLDDLLASDYSADRPVLLYMKSTRRYVRNYPQDATVAVLLDMLEHAIGTVGGQREKNRTEGKTISQVTLQIMEAALASMEGKVAPRSQVQHEEQQRHGPGPSKLVAVEV